MYCSSSICHATSLGTQALSPISPGKGRDWKFPQEGTSCAFTIHFGTKTTVKDGSWKRAIPSFTIDIVRISRSAHASQSMCEKAFYHHQNDWLSTCAGVEVRARKQRALVILPSLHWFLSLRTHFWSKRPSTMISFNPSQTKPKYAIMVTTLARKRRKQETAKGRTLNLVRWGDNGLRIALSLTRLGRKWPRPGWLDCGDSGE